MGGSEEMLYKELEDCEQCPFFNELCNGGWTSSPSGNPVEPPCTCWDGNDDLGELYNNAIDTIRRYEEAEDRRWEREQEDKKKKEERNRKARESRWAVREEQREINSLRKRIKNNNNIISRIHNIINATNFANQAFGHKERIGIKRNLIEVENEKLQARIDELILIKKEKLKQLRMNNKI